MEKSSKDRHPTHEATPPPERKIPRRLANPDPSGECPRWSFRFVDHRGPWCFSAMKGKQLGKVLKRLGEFEGMTFEQLTATGSHDLAPEAVSPEAFKRLRKINLEDGADMLYSLRMDGRRRIIALRDLSAVYILWWDPEHEVCPVHKEVASPRPMPLAPVARCA